MVLELLVRMQTDLSNNFTATGNVRTNVSDAHIILLVISSSGDKTFFTSVILDFNVVKSLMQLHMTTNTKSMQQQQTETILK